MHFGLLLHLWLTTLCLCTCCSALSALCPCHQARGVASSRNRSYTLLARARTPAPVTCAACIPAFLHLQAPHHHHHHHHTTTPFTHRRGLRAELGAFYPLLLLKPLEQEPPDLACLATVLSSMKQLCSDAQLVVDLFVNYDCDLQAANLYERTVAALCTLSQCREVEVQVGGVLQLLDACGCSCRSCCLCARLVGHEEHVPMACQRPNSWALHAAVHGPSLAQHSSPHRDRHRYILLRPRPTRAPAPQGNAQAKAEAAAKLASLREMALKCAFQVVTALDAWAGPIKDTSERTSDMDEASSSTAPAASAASDKGEGSPLARDGTPGGRRCSRGCGTCLLACLRRQCSCGCLLMLSEGILRR
jgi:hypothetical protein